MGEWIAWRPEYCVSVDEIDEQHKELFRIFNEFGDAMWDGKGRDTVAEALKFLAQYTVEHFRSEEQIMLEHNYPDYTKHKQVHDALVEEVSEFVRRYNSEEVPLETTVKVFNRVGDWTREHVRGMDQEMGRYVASKMK